MDTIQRYQSLPIHNVILTKLDETSKFGGIYNVLSQVAIPVSYLSGGQRVPEDLESATPQRLVELVCGDHGGMRPVEHQALVEVAHS